MYSFQDQNCFIDLRTEILCMISDTPERWKICIQLNFNRVWILYSNRLEISLWEQILELAKNALNKKTSMNKHLISIQQKHSNNSITTISTTKWVWKQKETFIQVISTTMYTICCRSCTIQYPRRKINIKQYRIMQSQKKAKLVLHKKLGEKQRLFIKRRRKILINIFDLFTLKNSKKIWLEVSHHINLHFCNKKDRFESQRPEHVQ